MNVHHFIYMMIGSAALLFASCGQQHKAESLVKDFMEQNLKDASALTKVEFNDIDSTRYINDSIVTVIRQNTKKSALQYKTDISYGKVPMDRMLIMARVNYCINNKEYSDTYYMDMELTNIVAFKSVEK